MQLASILLLIQTAAAPVAESFCSATRPPACVSCSATGCGLALGDESIALNPRGQRSCLGPVCATCVANPSADPPSAGCTISWPGGGCGASWINGEWFGGCW